MFHLKKTAALLVSFVLAVSIQFGQQPPEKEPLVAVINAEISAQDVSVILEHIFLYPNERSLYGPGEENYGMPVKDEYRNGPVVVVDIKKKPDWVGKFMSGNESDWISIELFSEGRPLSWASAGSDGIYGFSFWTESSQGESIELKELGNIECRIRLSTIEKVSDLAVRDLARGAQPHIEDEDVRVWDIRWLEQTKSYLKEPEIKIEIGVEPKKKFMDLIVAFIHKDTGEDIWRTSASRIPNPETPKEGRISFACFIAKNKIAKAELWKVVPVITKTFQAKFVPQKQVFRD